MSLRDFNSTDDRPISLQNVPAGNGSGLSAFHTVNPEDVEPSNTPKIVGGLALALMVGVAGIGFYAYSGSSSQPKLVVTASNQPSPPAAAPAPQQIADATKSAKAATIDPNSMRSAMGKTPSAMDNASAPAPTAPVKIKTASAKPVRASALPGAASARMSAGSNQASSQPAVIPEPVSPTPSPSDIATTNTQSGVAVPQGAATASDIPAPQPAAPALDQQPPAQSAGQVNQ